MYARHERLSGLAEAGGDERSQWFRASAEGCSAPRTAPHIQHAVQRVPLILMGVISFCCIGLHQRFSIPVIAHRMLLLSLQTFVVFKSKCPAKCTSQDIPPWFQFEAIVYTVYSIQSVLKCARREFKLYIFTEVYDVTLVRAWRCCAAQIHESMFRSKQICWEVNFNRFPLLREKGACQSEQFMHGAHF